MIPNADLEERLMRKKRRLNDSDLWECLRSEYRNSTEDQIISDYEGNKLVLCELNKVDKWTRKAIDAPDCKKRKSRTFRKNARNELIFWD